MSWPQWPTGGVPQPGVVQSALLNPASNILNTPTPLMPSSQYTPEQWAQMQQQNWQQWAQWQQQFQQWQQQYGAEYQKSINALTQNRTTSQIQQSMPLFNNMSVSVPPPLPVEPTKPPLPPDDSQPNSLQQSANSGFQQSHYSNAPPPLMQQPTFAPVPPPVQPPQPSNQTVAQQNPASSQSGLPNQNSSERHNNPQQQYHHQQRQQQQQFGGNKNLPRNNARESNQNWRPQNNPNTSDYGGNRAQNQFTPLMEAGNKPDFRNKRAYNQPNESVDAKRSRIEQNERWSSGNQQQQLQQWGDQSQNQPQWKQQSETTPKSNTEELTDAEKKFDKQFADWEAQFQKWKQENINHPDKNQYREYEKKWETWRAQLLDRREQMRRKRLGLTTASPSGIKPLMGGPEGNQVKPMEQSPGRNAQDSFKSDIKSHNPQQSSNVFPSSTMGKPSPSKLHTSTVLSDHSSDRKPSPSPDIEIISYSRPPPNMNNQPLNFKKANPPFIETHSQKETKNDLKNNEMQNFLKTNQLIPGLDLVDKAEMKSDEEREDNSGKPDFEAISRGINNILGDQKILNMLSLVSQNQIQSPAAQSINTTSAIKLNSSIEPLIQKEPNQADGFSFDDRSQGNFAMPHDASGNKQFPNFGQEPNKFDRDNFYQEQKNFERNLSRDFERNRNAWNNPDHFDNNYQPRNNFNRGPNDFGRNEPNNFNRNRPDDFNTNPNKFNKGPNNFQGHDDFNNAMRKPANFNFLRNPENENIGDAGGFNNFNRPPIDHNRRSTNFNTDGDRFNRNAVNFNRNFNPDANTNFNRGPDNNNLRLENRHSFMEAESKRDCDNFRGNYFEQGRDVKESHGTFQPPQPGWNRDNSFSSNVPNVPTQSFEPMEDKSKTDVQDDVIWKADNVIDYDHKSRKPVEPDVILEPIHTFDYRHKPLNRIPYPLRPQWLSELVKRYASFNLGIPRFEPPHVRRYPPPNERYDSYQKYENRDRKPYEDRDRKLYGNKDMPWKSFDNKPPEGRRVTHEYDERRPLPNDSKKESNTTKTEVQTRNDYYENVEDSPPFIDEEAAVEDNAKVNTVTNVVASSKSNVTLIEDLLNSPGRHHRPARLVIIIRGPPGSGKSFLAKLIKDKEVENGGSAPRIICLDDYFMVEQDKEIEEDGKKTKVKEMVYEYEEEMEESYRQSLMKSFKKTITDGYFNFVIVDNVNDKVKYFGEMWSFAKQNGFQVYICQLELDVQTCTKRNIHGRTEVEIVKCVSGWESTPPHHPLLDATSLIQSGSIPEVEMEEINSPPSSDNINEEEHFTSKWDNFDYSIDNLAKLDGTNKPLRPSRTMEDYLQLEDEWVQPATYKPGQKRVRWADLEERKKQDKMRAIGFVVGQTNWDVMMNPTMGAEALTQTKYIERYN